MSKAGREIHKQNLNLQRSYIDQQLEKGNNLYIGNLYLENQLYFKRMGYSTEQLVSEKDMIKFEGVRIYRFRKTA